MPVDGGGRRLLREVRASLAVAAGFAALFLPLVAVRVDTVERTVRWRWGLLAWLAAGAGALSWLWRARQRAAGGPGAAAAPPGGRTRALPGGPAARAALAAAAAALALAFPWLFSSYQVNVMISALLFVMLGLGLSIVVGLAGLLNLGYAAFYAVGAYTYALLHARAGLGFWAALPAGGLLAAAFGVLLGFPVLRLRGDYLAIVTLGFGEIVRLVLENWSGLANGPAGIGDIPRPTLPGVALGLGGATILLYYIALALALATAAAVARLRDSRVGRAWLALREDETAAEAMGVDPARTKLAAFALGAFVAGVAGVLFAAKTTFVNPSSFTFLESAMILAVVVLGGMGSVAGVATAALLLVLLPEYLRAFAQYRMLLFGAALVLMMVFRPGGLSRLAGRGRAPAGGRGA
jgi:branched-chain amino acid transport system permease protein